MLPLNLFAFDDDDRYPLLDSYNAIAKIGNIDLVIDAIELEIITHNIIASIQLDANSQIGLQNVFKVDIGFATFYICQVLFDRFFHENGQKVNSNYEFHIVGMAKINYELGDAVVKKKTGISFVMDKLFNQKNNFGESKSFIKKYLLIADDYSNFDVFFNEQLLDEIAKHDIVLRLENNLIMIHFEQGMQEPQENVLRNIFSKMPFISKF